MRSFEPVTHFNPPKSFSLLSAKKVLLGMSGGIDSTVSAMLLLEQGYEVIGCTFRTYDSIKDSCLAREKGCCDVESLMEARANCARMGIEHHLVDYREVFRRQVIAPFVEDYCHGRTPNPCVLCNCHIKWGEMLRMADELGCDYVATGHYARIDEGFLALARDDRKDQTYFLWMLTENQLRRTIFPLGDLTKDEVRKIAHERGYERLVTKHESQDICFVPGGDYRQFLADYLAPNPVPRQAMYTIGQRKGLGIALGYPAFVTHIDPETGEPTFGRREELNADTVSLRSAFFRGDASRPLSAKVRYRSPSAACRMEEQTDGTIVLRFDSPVWAPTPGQSCVIYQDDRVVGGGIIA